MERYDASGWTSNTVGDPEDLGYPEGMRERLGRDGRNLLNTAQTAEELERAQEEWAARNLGEETPAAAPVAEAAGGLTEADLAKVRAIVETVWNEMNEKQRQAAEAMKSKSLLGRVKGKISEFWKRVTGVKVSKRKVQAAGAGVMATVLALGLTSCALLPKEDAEPEDTGEPAGQTEVSDRESEPEENLEVDLDGEDEDGEADVEYEVVYRTHYTVGESDQVFESEFDIYKGGYAQDNDAYFFEGKHNRVSFAPSAYDETLKDDTEIGRQIFENGVRNVAASSEALGLWSMILGARPQLADQNLSIMSANELADVLRFGDPDGYDTLANNFLAYIDDNVNHIEVGTVKPGQSYATFYVAGVEDLNAIDEEDRIDLNIYAQLSATHDYEVKYIKLFGENKDGDNVDLLNQPEVKERLMRMTGLPQDKWGKYEVVMLGNCGGSQLGLVPVSVQTPTKTVKKTPTSTPTGTSTPTETEKPETTTPTETEKPETEKPETTTPTDTEKPETERPETTTPTDTENPEEEAPPEEEGPGEEAPPEEEKPPVVVTPEEEKPAPKNEDAVWENQWTPGITQRDLDEEETPQTDRPVINNLPEAEAARDADVTEERTGGDAQDNDGEPENVQEVQQAADQTWADDQNFASPEMQEAFEEAAREAEEAERLNREAREREDAARREAEAAAAASQRSEEEVGAPDEDLAAWFEANFGVPYEP